MPSLLPSGLSPGQTPPDDAAWAFPAEDSDHAAQFLSRSRAYPAGTIFAAHSHQRGQFLFCERGTIQVDTAPARWVVPPGRGLWIPAGLRHAVTALEAALTCSFYAHDTEVSLPRHVAVMGITPFLRMLLLEASTMIMDDTPGSRGAALRTLMLHELRRLPILPLSLPMPSDARLAGKCRSFLRNPTPHASIDVWSAQLGLSRRAFTRLFRSQTGSSFSAWCRQACLFAALPRLSAGESVTSVALDLGYANPAAFATMFRRALGFSPSAVGAQS